MRHDAEVSIQDPSGVKGSYPCPACRRDTWHLILSIVNSNHFDESGLVQFWDHYLTVQCSGCGTISFCHESECSEEEDFDERGFPFLVKHRKYYPGIAAEPEQFVDLSYIEDLQSIPKSNFDTMRLTQMLVELNRAYAGDSFLSCLFLLRAILDHIPPIFNFDSFAKVANNYAGGGKSFRNAMQHLEKSLREMANLFLHAHIQGTEVIPTKAQAEFRADMAFLLSEVIRILRGKL